MNNSNSFKNASDLTVKILCSDWTILEYENSTRKSFMTQTARQPLHIIKNKIFH